MKSILISIRPEWVAKILNGEKTIEIRKTAPKCELPIEVYIYCTKGKTRTNVHQDKNWNGKVDKKGINVHQDTNWNGKIVAKFTLWKIERFGMAYPYEEPTSSLLDKACVTLGQARTYAGGKHPYYKPLYAWHISDLVIFDRPKELEEFKREIGRSEKVIAYKPITKAPQSWCYCEEL